MGEDFDGADDGVGGGSDGVGFLDDAAEGSSDVAIALFVEAGGMSVAIEGTTVDLVVVGQLADVVPADEGFVDFFAGVGVANAAAGLVVLEAGGGAGASSNGFFLPGERLSVRGGVCGESGFGLFSG